MFQLIDVRDDDVRVGSELVVRKFVRIIQVTEKEFYIIDPGKPFPFNELYPFGFI
jgi:hypothetical protein